MQEPTMEQRIFKRIFQVSNKLQATGDSLSNELTLKQWFLLLLLYHGSIKNPTINEIASAMGVTRQSAKKMVATLERGEYLTVGKSRSDSRALCISPTAKTYNFFTKNKTLGYDLLKKTFAGIEQQDLTTTFLVLEKMHANLIQIKNNEK